MSHRENLLRIKAVYNALEELAKDVVFVGGATVSLYTDRVAEEVRPTDDIDILVELVSYQGYADIEEKLRQKGFINDWESGVICRYKVQGIIVDVMPTSDQILGFSNRWYMPGFSNAIDYTLDKRHIIKIFAPPYFLATKLEAFNNRGHADGRTSTDFEDIVYFLNNRSTIWEELQNMDTNCTAFLCISVFEIVKNGFYPILWSNRCKSVVIRNSLNNFFDKLSAC